jgi:hypothetical protein
LAQSHPVFLAVALLGTLGLSAAPIRLRNRTLDPPAESRISPDSLPRHVLLQFDAPPGADVLAELARRGIRVLRRVPENTVLAATSEAWDLAGLPLRWAGPLEAADKLSAELGAATAAGYLIMFHPDVTGSEAGELVEMAGLAALSHSSLLPGQVLATGPEDRVRKLAERDEVAYILPASADLMAGNPVVACGGPLEEGETVAQYVKVGRGWRQVNGEVELRYVLVSLTARMPESTIRTEVARALEEWARYAQLRFTAGTDASGSRTIAIQFARGAHGDAYAFDGAGKVLAHTFYPAPPNSEPLAGDIHLDDEESWGAGSGVDLYSVVLHEAGHALGLGHSDSPGAVMYPYYRLSTALGNDDIAGIRALYGERQGSAPSPPSSAPTNPTPTNPPSNNPTPSNPTTSNPPAGGSDRTPPTLRITNPAFTVVATSAASITFRGSAADNVGVAAVNWSTSSGASGKASGTSDWTAAEIPLLSGNNTVTVRALDAAGNSTWRAVTVVRR